MELEEDAVALEEDAVALPRQQHQQHQQQHRQQHRQQHQQQHQQQQQQQQQAARRRQKPPSDTVKIKGLEAALAEKLECVTRLRQEHDQLRLQDALMTQLCQELSRWYLRRQEGCAAAEGEAPAEALLFEILLGDPEFLVARQLDEEAGPPQPLALGGGLGPQQPIAPDGDLMALARRVLALPPHPDAKLGLGELREQHTLMVARLALILQQLDAGMGAVRPAASDEQLVGEIERLLLDHMRLQRTLVLRHRAKFLALLSAGGGGGGSSGDPAEAADGIECYQHVAVQLGLDQGQKRRIAAGLAVANRLLGPVLLEQQQLQLQAAGPKPPGAFAAAAAAARGGAPPGGLLSAPWPLAGSVEGQELHLARVERVANKDVFLRLMLAYFTCGCLSWRGLARLYVLLAPSVPLPGMLARVVAAQLEREAASSCATPATAPASGAAGDKRAAAASNGSKAQPSR